MDNPKDLLGANKLPLHLWPTTATALGCLALLDGALKYGRQNFRAIGVRASIYYDATLRHMQAWFEGEDVDPESGLPHLAHALACIAILIESDVKGNLMDDRAYPTQYRELITTLTPYVTALREHHAEKHVKHYMLGDSCS